MKHFSMACILGLLVAPVCIAQNGLKGLRDYLQEYKFSLFVPPRANATLDTVVNYSGGYETIVTSKCIPTDKVKPSELSTVVLTAKTGNLTKTLGLEGSFARALDPSVTVSGAYNDSRVQKIEISFEDAKETHVESKDLKDYIQKLDPSDSCKATLVNKKNRVLGSLLQVTGVKYTFYDKDGKSLKLDLALLKAIKLAPKYQKDYENTDSLQVKTPIYIGYRAWKVREIPGAVKNLLVAEESEPEEIVGLKQKQPSRNTKTISH